MADSMSLVRGTVDILILNALAGGPQHGYAVVAWIRDVTDDALSIEDGALYTALHRMEKRGWLRPEWGVSPRGRRAKYYSLTEEGQSQRDLGERTWTRYSEAVAKVFAARQLQEV